MNELSERTKDILIAEINNATKMTESYIATERMSVPQWMISA